MESVKCPLCNEIVEWDDTYDHDIYDDCYVERCSGTCPKCGEIVEYEIIFPLKEPYINIIDHYNFNKTEEN